MTLTPERDRAIRSAPKYSEMCPLCGEKRLMWKLDFSDGQVKLWQPFHFHVCATPVATHAQAVTE